MKVQEFRDLTFHLLRTADAWHACVDDKERAAWSAIAARVYTEFKAAVCARANARDLAMRATAEQKYNEIIGPSISQTLPAIRPMPPASRAAKYNRSPGRAVRMARAARSAMRRGYY